MKCTVYGLHLQGEVVFIACDPPISLPFRSCHDHSRFSLIEVFIGSSNCTANFIGRAPIGVTRQVRRDETSLAVHHVTTRTFHLPKEKGPAGFRITGQWFEPAVAL